MDQASAQEKQKETLRDKNDRAEKRFKDLGEFNDEAEEDS